MLNRRKFIQHGSMASTMVAMPAMPVWALGGQKNSNGRLIIIFLRGGLDGLFAFSPVGDPRLSALRPSLSAKVLKEGLPLGNTGFAAHPSAKVLADLFASGELLFSPVAGTTDASRSHFQAQDLFELGNGKTRGDEGFLARAANALGSRHHIISFTHGIPLALKGSDIPPRVAPPTGSGLTLPAGDLGNAIRKVHQGHASGIALEQANAIQSEINQAKNAAATMNLGMDAQASRGAAGANGFAKVGDLIGRMLRNNTRLPLAFVDLGGMDTHVNQEGTLSRTLPAIGAGVLAIKSALGSQEWRRTQVVVMSEFGRTVRENGTRGTDHGHGGLYLMAGGAISGGRMLGDFAGLQDTALNQKRDLPVLLDWRTLLANSMAQTCEFSIPTLDMIFPGKPNNKLI